jgi:uncharacterized membrane protein (DUF2068 family)
MQTVDPQSHRQGQGSSSTEDAGVKPPAKPLKRRRQRGLLLVGLYKVTEATLVGALGVGALHLVNRDIGSVVLRVTDALRIDPESRVVGMLMDRADMIGGHQLREFGLFTFAYALLHLVEGTGLVLEKTWAEYFTVVLTMTGLPWESYELIRRFTWLKVGLLLVNLAVLIYLVWVLRRKKREKVSVGYGKV